MSTWSAWHAREVLVTDWSQAMLQGATVVVVGVGGLGTEVAKLLAQSGVGHLVLCDPDRVEESNLSRGALFTRDHIGTDKVSAAKASLRAIAPRTEVDARKADFKYAIGLAELRSATLVVSCLDNAADRIALCGRTFLSGSTGGVLDAGTHPWGGEVRHFTRDGFCYACGCSALDGALPAWSEACGQSPEPGAGPTVTALVASWQALFAVQLLFGQALPTPIIEIEAAAMACRQVTLPPHADRGCPCHKVIEKRRVKAVPLTNQARVAELLAYASATEQVQSWNPVPPRGMLSLSAAAPDARLQEVGIPPGEILPVVDPRPGGLVRFLELRSA